MKAILVDQQFHDLLINKTENSSVSSTIFLRVLPENIEWPKCKPCESSKPDQANVVRLFHEHDCEGHLAGW